MGYNPLVRRLLVLLLLAGCAPGASSAGDADALARLLDGRVAGNPGRCVPARQNEALRVIDKRTLAYGSGATIYVNRLDRACPGLEPFNTLITEVHAGQHCRGDRIRSLEPGSSIPGPPCLLGDFVPYRRAK